MCCASEAARVPNQKLENGNVWRQSLQDEKTFERQDKTSTKLLCNKTRKNDEKRIRSAQRGKKRTEKRVREE
jgi:hypothetical protein